MKKHTLRRFLALVLAFAMLAGYMPPAQAQNSTGLHWEKTDIPITAELPSQNRKTEETESLYDPSDMLRVSIVLEKKSTIKAGYSTSSISTNAQAIAYNNTLHAEQQQMAAKISSQVLGGNQLDVVWNLTLVGNIISANVAYSHIAAIEKLDGVAAVVIEQQYAPCTVDSSNTAQPQMFASVEMVGSSLVWSTGYTGAGSRIAVIDTGTDTQHQSLNNGAYLYALQQNAAAAGVSYQEYLAGLDLLDASEIASVLPYLNITELIGSVSASQLYLNEKLPFAANYVDGNLTVDHMSDWQGEHGSHVAGIATANRYIPSGSGYVDALQSVLVAGNAPDAQLITMKVFGYSSPYDSDYMAAIEDAIWLNCDAVNLSLGSSSPGSSMTPAYSDLLDYMTTTDTVVVASAGNSGAWADASAFSYLYSDDVNFHTGGNPGSYGSFFTVASVNNDGSMSAMFEINGTDFLYLDGTNSYYAKPLHYLDISANGTGSQYDFVFIDGLGYSEDYAGMDLSGKIVFCSRGETNFSDKARIAVAKGAVAVIIYNNVSGLFGMDLAYYYDSAPCASISKESADAIRAGATPQTSSAGIPYYTGKITISAGYRGIFLNSEYYTMSDFSSWGVPSDLSLKPEITAPGGNIYSIWGTNLLTGGGSTLYESMSGTSMAAPSVTGMTALMAQYIRENGLDTQEGITVRKLAQSLLMSTAVPMLEENSGGNYYSLLNQGAGLARVDLAIAADSYILVNGQNDGKVKAELGDDPNRTGIYEFSFTIHNLSGKKETYILSADLFCQDNFEYQPNSGLYLLDTWTTPLPGTATFSVNGKVLTGSDSSYDCDLNGDGTTDARDADYLLEYILGNVAILYANGDLDGDGQLTSYDAHMLMAGKPSDTPTVTVPANGSTTISVRLDLTAKGRSFLDTNYSNGTYVQAYVYAESLADTEGLAGTCHSIPVLAFYGNWSDPSMFDRGTTVEYLYGEETTTPYLYLVNDIYGNALIVDYSDGMEYYYGGNPVCEEEAYLPERNAFNSLGDSILTEQTFTLIRNAGAARIAITNADTGETYFERDLGALLPAYYNVNYGAWENTIQYAKLNWWGTNAYGQALPEGTRVNVTLMAAPEYCCTPEGTCDFRNLGDGAYLTTTFTIDNTAPEILSVDDSRVDSRILTVSAQDNRHIAAVALLNAAGTKFLAVESPNQTTANVPITLDLDLADVIGQTFLVAVYDYARNVTVYEVTLDLPEIERPYFTAIDYYAGSFIGLDTVASTSTLCGLDVHTTVVAAEYVEGHIFVATTDHMLYVTDDNDLTATFRVGQLDPWNEYMLSAIVDMAYNYADGKLYALAYSRYNSEAYPYLFTLDTDTGRLEYLCEMPVDVHTLAIDDSGNCYSAAYGRPELYTYTIQGAMAGSVTYVGTMGYYYTSSFCSMAWDHDQDALYFAFPGTLLRINPKTAEPTLLGYYNNNLVGLFIRPAAGGNRFQPTDTVKKLELNTTDTRVLSGNSIKLEATVMPWYATDRTVTWTSSNPSVASVSPAGVVTGNSSGTCVITATSNLDPSFQASCYVEVFTLDKTLNALVWDEEGGIWMSEFSTGSLPDYTKLSSGDLGYGLASATMTPDGTIYAASQDSSLRSELYKLDPVTFTPTYIGASSAGYVDLAPAPSMPGNSLAAVYYSYVLLVNANSGDYYYFYYMFNNDLVGIAYAGSTPYTDGGYNTNVDWYFIIDRVGCVYYMGFLEQYGNYYYLEDDVLAPNGIYGNIGFEMETSYFGSAYYDGEMLYFSAFQESDNNVTLLAMDIASGTKAVYTLGTFSDGVWPVAGLMELDTPPSFQPLHTATAAQPQKMETSVELAPMAEASIPEKAGTPTTVPTGGPNSISVPMVVEEESSHNSEETITVTTPQDTVSGILKLEFDSSELEVLSVSGSTDAFAWSVENGCLTIAYAAGYVIPANTAIASVTFRSLPSGDHLVELTHTQLGRQDVSIPSSYTIHGHDFQSAVTAPTCTEEGYTTYTCHCGHSYVGNYTDPIPHTYQAVVTPPTCIEKGYTTYTCHCGDSYVGNYTDFGNHAYNHGSCSVCGKTLYGDLNSDGMVDVTDAYYIILAYKEQITLNQEQLQLADVDGNGRVDMADAYCILLLHNGEIAQLPVERKN